MSIPKPTLRSSSMPLFMTCGNAILNPDELQSVDTEIEAATVGHLVHAEAENLVARGTYDLEAIERRLSPQDYARATLLFNNFLDVWKEARMYMKTPLTEWEFSVELSHVILTGHIDVHAIEAQRAFILDYKTGRQHEDHFHQMAAYAFGVWDKAGRPKDYNVFVTSVYLEDKTIVPYTFTSDTLLTWEKEVAAQVLNKKYVVGRKCAFCQLQGACPAYRTFATGALRVLNDDVSVAWDDMTPEERGDLLDRMYVVEKAIDRIKLSLRNLVRKRGNMDIGEKQMILVDEIEKQINLTKAMPVVIDAIGEEAFVRTAKLSLASLLTAVAARAPKGIKMKARAEMLERLEKAGAIMTSKTTKMFRRPKGEQVLEEEK